MTSKQKIVEAFKEDWYIQGFNAVPAFIIPSAWSGFSMQPQIGFSYTKFLFHFRNGYCEMHYWRPDLERLWRVIHAKLERNPRFLRVEKQRHEKRFRDFLTTFSVIDRIRLARCTERDLFSLLRRCVNAQIESVGASHCIESASIALENILLRQLKSRVEAKRVNVYFSRLTTPSTRSFVGREERDLFWIGSRHPSLRPSLLSRHARRYGWIRNSYVGEVMAPVSYFSRRLKQAQNPGVSLAEIQQQKKRLIAALRLDATARRLIDWIDVCTGWQDERKENVLRTITYLGRVINELSRRTRIPRTTLRFFTAREMLSLSSFPDVRAWAPKLSARRAGCIILAWADEEIIVCGREHEQLLKRKDHRKIQAAESENELHATTANCGTAIGRVVICKGLASLGKVKKGDVIVASMTRPEFAPALKKAVAIVTDEGGITCHAAIVARELNIPCVIGVKIATKVLRDGMTVEVKANHGVVKVLTQSPR